MVKLSKLPLPRFLARFVGRKSPSGAVRRRGKPRVVSRRKDSQESPPKPAGEMSARTGAILRRAYLLGHLTKPIEECTDDELLIIRGIGKKTLAEIREASRGKSI